MKLQAPFPWFGGKSRVASLVWERFGNVTNYVEPFFGSGAVLLNRPHEPNIETINDKDGLVANFWRAIKNEPEATAEFANNPVNENDLHARHAWLLKHIPELASRLEGDPDFCDPKIAGFWAWGICCWIGSGFCSGQGPWKVVEGRLVRQDRKGGGNQCRQMPELRNHGAGVNKQRPHLGNAGLGVSRQMPMVGGSDRGILKINARILEWFRALSKRLRRVRVCCGDWRRIMRPSVTFKNGLTGVFLDPPYSVEDRAECYLCEDFDVAKSVREWCLKNGENKSLRIALCGYASEHDLPGWTALPWKACGGYGNQSKQHDNPNARREMIWFSPHCLNYQGKLF